jgi:hypothetical protein
MYAAVVSEKPQKRMRLDSLNQSIALMALARFQSDAILMFVLKRTLPFRSIEVAGLSWKPGPKGEEGMRQGC